ncbi:cytochrome c oxidase subunit II [Vibrio breoganii]|uniref:Cytochrome c oxidase subunit 2 n=1 Tax=Vibrio breoganii TaxID=553239 RepID=A0AAP8MV54_9VIBR|nr:cytochrome c oxidase subunit II [Vibrio breoganii]PMP10762.1 cytochrome c oxidase subunit II [Vibrio breoganii]
MRDHKVMRSFERVVDRLRAWFFSLCFGVLVSAPSTVSAENTESSFNMTQGVTEISGKVYHLHMLIFYICVAIAVVVFGVMFYSIIKHRKSKGAVAANFHESTKVEIIWTVIPILILIGMAIPATKTLIEMEDTSESDITVKITGSQWKWHYSYFDHDVEFFSYLSTSNEQIEGTDEKGEHYLLEVDNALVLPIGKKIRFLMTSDDVIHSWWVPDFAVKKDTIPGFINEAWTKIDKPGIYRGQCAELCGRNHGFMPIVVQAVEAAEFDEWIANKEQELAAAKLEEQKALEKTLGMDELMALGKDVYEGRCAVCHQSNGLGVANVFPAMKGSAVVLGDVNGHIDIIVNGVSGTAMQAFGTQLTAEEIAAVVTYERNAWDNNTGDVVQASDVSTQMNAEGE